MRLPGEHELRYGLRHPDKACFLGMTVLAVALVLHMLGIIPDFHVVNWSRVNLIQAATASERGK